VGFVGDGRALAGVRGLEGVECRAEGGGAMRRKTDRTGWLGGCVFFVVFLV
jgi:hypothetical protein